ncbi:LysE family translocator [Ulvibacterium sp.]|uniref:LysE family translocator n=1 Tax=Ulvibacterium sp. TaxID=2665914 RepID=UPI00260950A6|nr:LysE family translocator [Ulvibacterium sp.]
MDYEILLTFIGATAALAISPGPDNVYVLMQGMVHGKKYGLATAAGLMSGCLIHTTLLALGVSALIKGNDRLFFGIKLFGALYLFYLAFKVFRSDALKLSDTGVSKKSLTQLFKQGFIMNVLNPKVTIFFLAFFPAFLFSEELGTVVQFYVLGLLFILVSFSVFGLIAILAGNISKYLLGNPNMGIVLKWLQILVFVGIGLYILLSDK